MRSRNILLLIDSPNAARLNGILRFAKEHRWHVMFENRRGHRPEGWRGDGVLTLLRDDPGQRAFVRDLRRRRIPVVDLSETVKGVSLPRATGDNAIIGKLAADHFRERNFRHAAWFSSDWGAVQEARCDAFRAAWSEGPFRRWVWAESRDGRAHGDWPAFLSWLGECLRSAPKPLAVFAYSDFDAMRVLNACGAVNLAVPEEVAILGVDDNPLICENQSVPLSSIRHDLETVGYDGAALLQRLMDGQDLSARTVRIPPRGIAARRSTDVMAVSDPTVRRALDIIARRLTHPIGGAQIADALGLSRVKLDRLFATVLGHSVGDEILRQRIAKAKLLLRNGEDKLATVAAACGFCNAAYFVNRFKRETGLTPVVWKMRNG